jgi:hypothetical protein
VNRCSCFAEQHGMQLQASAALPMAMIPYALLCMPIVLYVGPGTAGRYADHAAE